MKEAPFLLTMQRIIGGIEVEGDLARRRQDGVPLQRASDT